MSELFLKLVDMSISASWLVLAVMVLRLLLRKAPKWLWPVLWGCVGLRLVCPVSVESALSLIPSAETVSPDIVYQSRPAIHSGVEAIDRVVNPIVGQTFAPASPVASVNPLQIWVAVLAMIWAVGLVALLIYAGASYLRLRRRVDTAVRLRDGVYQSEGADTPFVLGLFRPRIYLPFHLSEGDAELVIAHEQAHIARRDHWIKPLGFLLLCIYWFHPILWAAYALLCRDIELACDERVIRDLAADRRADYSQALLSCSVRRWTIAACPLAFGEVGVKERVKHVLNYKKPALWLAIAAVVCCAVVAVCFLTDPPADAAEEDGDVTGLLLVDNSGPSAAPIESEPPSAGPGESAAPSADPVSAPDPEAVPLTEENAETVITSVLGSLRVEEDREIGFTIPEELPVPEDEDTKLTITLNATYSSEPGTFSVIEFLDWETDWTAGQVYSVSPRSEQGELVKVMLRVAYMTQLEGNTYHEYAAGYVELSAPSFENVYAGSGPSLELTQEGRDVTAAYLLYDGSRFTFSLTLPEGVTARTEADPSQGDVLPVVILRDQDGDQAGIWSLYALGTSDEASLSQVDTAENVLPMQIFAPVALSNHAYFEGYNVVKHSATGASATNRYMWQDLFTPGYEGRAADIPWQGVDCVLAYDWSAAPCFVQLLLGDGLFTPEQVAAVAESVTIR